jgi:hypothetical protein
MYIYIYICICICIYVCICVNAQSQTRVCEHATRTLWDGSYVCEERLRDPPSGVVVLLQQNKADMLVTVDTHGESSLAMSISHKILRMYIELTRPSVSSHVDAEGDVTNAVRRCCDAMSSGMAHFA